MIDYRLIYKDYRTITSLSKIIIINKPIININNFNDNMLQLGYSKLTNNFLIKNFNNIEIDISKNNNMINSIMGYDNNKNLIQIPNDIINQVQNDITQSNI